MGYDLLENQSRTGQLIDLCFSGQHTHAELKELNKGKGGLVDLLGTADFREVERRVMLSVIDEKWRDHLYEMDMLKEGIGLRAWGQKDPLIEYKREAYTAFEAMMEGLGEEIIKRFFRVSIVQGPPGSEPRPPAGPGQDPPGWT